MAEDDKAEVREILNLYAFALDSHQFDLFDLVFTDDVRAEFGPAGMEWKGLEALKATFLEFHDTLTNHQHQMFGQLVHVNGDKANAFSYGNWLLVRDDADGGPAWLGCGWYDDELVRTSYGWRISDRIAKLVSWTGNPKVPVPVHKPDMNTNVLSEFCQAGKIRYLKALKAAR